MSDGVFWLTTTLEFPKDKDRWVKQEPIPGNHQKWVYRNCHALTDIQKRQLSTSKEISWQDHNGVWVKVQILDRKVETKWGSHSLLTK